MLNNRSNVLNNRKRKSLQLCFFGLSTLKSFEWGLLSFHVAFFPIAYFSPGEIFCVLNTAKCPHSLELENSLGRVKKPLCRIPLSLNILISCVISISLWIRTIYSKQKAELEFADITVCQEQELLLQVWRILYLSDSLYTIWILLNSSCLTWSLEPKSLYVGNLNANNEICFNEPQLQKEIISNLNDCLERILLSALINKINNMPANQLWSAAFVCFSLYFGCLTSLWASLSQNVCHSLMPRVTSPFSSLFEIQ